MPQPPKPVLDALRRGSLVLTPTDRAARALRSIYDKQDDTQPAAIWRPANVSPFATWLQALWSGLIVDGHETRLLLNAAQEHLVWQRAIEAGPAFESMGTLDALAALAASAWSRAAAYGLPPDDLGRAATTHDARLFAAWAAEFRTLCGKNQYLSAAELPSALRDHVEAGTLLPPAEILLFGFPASGSELATEALTPVRSALLDTLGERGTNITYIAAELPRPSAAASLPMELRAICRAPDPQTELRTALHWVRSYIEQRAAAGLPHTVALLVPTLDEEASALDAALREVLAPELNLVSADLSAGPYAIAPSTPLAATPTIAAALDLLRWSTGPLPAAVVGALLLSPYTAPLETLASRAEFDAFTLRAAPLLRPELDLDTLLTLARRGRRGQTSEAANRKGADANAAEWPPSEPEDDAAPQPSVKGLLQTWHTALRPLATSRPQPYSEWTEAFRAALRAAGWPGNRPLTAAEFALTRAWDHMLDLVATLDFTPARVDFATALAAVTRAAQQAPAAQPDVSASVQVMQPAEASGCTFDAVVFLRATDAAWPRPERAHPLLAYSLQRERRMPGADPQLASARAAQLTAELAAAAPTFLAFYAERNAEGEQRLSPLMAALPQHPGQAEAERLPTLEAAALLPLPADAAVVQEEELEDTAPIPPLPPGQTRGGASVLELQAACAFHAFAALRLNANEPEVAQLGFDARELGNFLHRSLENFWADVRTQATLRALPLAERRTRLEAAIDLAAAAHPPALTAWDAAYLHLQKTRMAAILMQWLDRELERGPFEVTEHEKSRELAVGPLTLSVRLDRVDAVDGGTLLVDYKTGRRGSPSDWLSDRPDAPQLPLYALLPEADSLQGLAFAKVRTGNDMKWHGYAPAGVLPRPTPMPFATWEDQRAEWRATLEQLAQSFYDGDAAVSPKDYPNTCTHCAHRLLCRIHAPQPERPDDEDLGAEQADSGRSRRDA